MLSGEVKGRLKTYLLEDLGKGDVSVAITPEKKCSAIVKANEACTLAGIEEAKFLAEWRGLKFRALKKDGSAVKKGTKILWLRGSGRKILEIERVLLNILGRMSGVATLASKAVKIRGAKNKTVLAATRKTIPGFQLLDKKAAEVSGLWTHRKSLNEMVLLKDNHLKFFSSPFEAVREAVEKVKSGKKKDGEWKGKSKKVEVEVETLKEALNVAAAKPDFIMLDNFSPTGARKAVHALRNEGFKGRIELSGGITLKNLKSFINADAGIISMGEITKKAKIVDFSLDIKKMEKQK